MFAHNDALLVQSRVGLEWSIGGGVIDLVILTKSPLYFHQPAFSVTTMSESLCTARANLAELKRAQKRRLPVPSDNSGYSVVNIPVAQTKTLIRAQKHCLVWREKKDAVVDTVLSNASSLCLAQTSSSHWACLLPFAQGMSAFYELAFAVEAAETQQSFAG